MFIDALILHKVLIYVQFMIVLFVSESFSAVGLVPWLRRRPQEDVPQGQLPRTLGQDWPVENQEEGGEAATAEEDHLQQQQQRLMIQDIRHNIVWHQTQQCLTSDTTMFDIRHNNVWHQTQQCLTTDNNVWHKTTMSDIKQQCLTPDNKVWHHTTVSDPSHPNVHSVIELKSLARQKSLMPNYRKD